MALNENLYRLKEFGLVNEADAGSYYDADPADVNSLMKGLEMKIIDLNHEEIEFDIIGIGAPIVNAVRRILIAEIPTMAIDKIHMLINTSIIQDEVLAHRLGLVPIKVDPRLFLNKGQDGRDTDEDTLKFELKVKCTKRANVSKDIPLSDDVAYINKRVYSKNLKFVPFTQAQKDLYGDVRPVHEDILLAVLNPGHEIELEAFCVKNIGREHAKFSPVSVASYRLMPHIKLLEEISGEKAKTLEKIFPGVIKISKKRDKEVAKVVDPRKIKCNRNIFFYDDLKDVVEVSKVKDHYIFTVESVGALAPDVLVLEAIDVLREKCTKLLNELKSLKI